MGASRQRLRTTPERSRIMAAVRRTGTGRRWRYAARCSGPGCASGCAPG